MTPEQLTAIQKELESKITELSILFEQFLSNDADYDTAFEMVGEAN